jgi:small subunit ribosomal protein S17
MSERSPDVAAGRRSDAAGGDGDAIGRGRRKVRTGVVVSDKMDKTVVVRIDRTALHPVYLKTMRRSAKLAAHDEANDAHVGDTVRVMETRPLSKSKRWRVVEIVERAK